MPKITFADVYRTRDGIETLFKLLKERDKRANISHRIMPGWTEHVKFVRSRPYKFWYLIRVLGEPMPVGAVYLSKMNEIGLFIFKKYHRKSYGRAALDAVIQRYGDSERLLANINPKNKGSIAFFERAGFAHIQNTYELRQPKAGGKK